MVQRALLLFVALQFALPIQAADKDRINLLRRPRIRVERSGLADQGTMPALIDDNPATSITADATVNAPMDIVFGFDGLVVTPERVTVRLPAKPPERAVTARLEVRVSLDSPDAGFQFVRADPLKPSGDVQEFTLPPTAAKWIMLRFTPDSRSKQVSIADVTILGREGPPASQYAFKETPAKALDVLTRLKKLSHLNVDITPEEAALFADVRDGKFQRWTFAEAALLASGVHNEAKRQSYLKRLDWMTESAKQAIAGAKSPLVQGDMLLRWLHKGPLSKGYKAQQTDMPVILDTGTYNCVSSALLFNVIAQRVGLDVRAIEVPDHAFSIVYYEGKHADVETTTPMGFDPARDKAAQQQFEKQTGFRYIPDNHRDQRREVGEVGLVAIVYYNHGVEHSMAKRHHEALLAYFRAMSLDPEFASAVKNALAELANWGVELAKAGKFDDAILVCGTGLELAPKDYTLLNNRKAIWSVWAESRMVAGQEDDALAILRKAAGEVPTEADYFRSLQAGLYIRRGEDLVRAKEWEKAMSSVAPALAKVDDAAQVELKNWQTGVRQRWARTELDQKNYERALDIVSAGLAKESKSDRLTEYLAYIVQQWVKDKHANDGEEAARILLSAQIKRFPENAGVREVALGHVGRVLRGLRDAGKFDEALASLEHHRPLLTEAAADKADNEAKELARAIYDGCARKRMDAMDWRGATDVYEQGLRQYPKDYQLTNNLVYVVQEWGKDALTKNGEAGAMDVLSEQMKRFREIDGIRDLGKNHVLRISRKLSDDGKYEDALAAITRHQDLVGGPKEAVNLVHSVYDQWANRFLKKNPPDWQGALDIYAKGLKQHPKDSHMENNAEAVIDKWARTYFPTKDWPAAIKVYEKGLERFPDSYTLKNNLEYCRKQEMK